MIIFALIFPGKRINNCELPISLNSFAMNALLVLHNLWRNSYMPYHVISHTNGIFCTCQFCANVFKFSKHFSMHIVCNHLIGKTCFL